jgi:hypothetical protein
LDVEPTACISYGEMDFIRMLHYFHFDSFRSAVLDEVVEGFL